MFCFLHMEYDALSELKMLVKLRERGIQTLSITSYKRVKNE